MKCCPLDMTWLCTHEITIAVINCTRSSWRKDLQVTTLIYGAIAVDSFWVRKSQFSLGVRPLVGIPYLGGWCNIDAHMGSINWIQWFKNKPIVT